MAPPLAAVLLTLSLARPAAAAAPTGAPAVPPKEKAVKVGYYGTDDRQLYSQMPRGLRASADAVAAVFDAGDVKENGERATLKLKKAKDHHHFCKDTKFEGEPVGAHGTAFLIHPTLLLSAGHVVAPKDCAGTRFVFGFTDAVGFDGEVPAANVYRCKRLVKHVKEDFRSGRDFAIIELDRPVTDRAPLELDFALPKKGDLVFALGHPLGHTLTYSGMGPARQIYADSGYYVAEIDVFGGNSGSPVFSDNRKVVGIATHGQEDHAVAYPKDSAPCYRLNQLESGLLNSGISVAILDYWASDIRKALSEAGKTPRP